MTILGYCPPWLRLVWNEVDAGKPCSKCGGHLYPQPGSNGQNYRCNGCHIVWGAWSLYQEFGAQEVNTRLQEIERQGVEHLRTITPEERRVQAKRDIEELFG